MVRACCGCGMCGTSSPGPQRGTRAKPGIARQPRRRCQLGTTLVAAVRGSGATRRAKRCGRVRAGQAAVARSLPAPVAAQGSGRGRLPRSSASVCLAATGGEPAPSGRWRVSRPLRSASASGPRRAAALRTQALPQCARAASERVARAANPEANAQADARTDARICGPRTPREAAFAGFLERSFASPPGCLPEQRCCDAA